jgi:hypothetical protein
LREKNKSKWENNKNATWKQPQKIKKLHISTVISLQKNPFIHHIRGKKQTKINCINEEGRLGLFTMVCPTIQIWNYLLDTKQWSERSLLQIKQKRWINLRSWSSAKQNLIFSAFGSISRHKILKYFYESM